MKIYDDWKFTIVVEEDIRVYDVVDSKGTDWYELMVELDTRKEKYVIGTDKNGNVVWVTTGKVSSERAPFEGGSVIVTDSFPTDVNIEKGDSVTWDGYKFSVRYYEAPARTKEDIEADLQKLLAELKTIK